MLYYITDYRLCGRVIVQSREDAITTALTFSTPVPNQLVLYTDGFAFSLVEDQNGTRVRKGFGPAVVFQMYETREIWNRQLYRLKGDPDIDRSEYVALAEAFAIALPWALRKAQTSPKMQGHQVIIFTDSQGTLSKLGHLGNQVLTEFIASWRPG